MSDCKSVFFTTIFLSTCIFDVSINIEVEEAGALVIMEGMGAPMEGGSRDPY